MSKGLQLSPAKAAEAFEQQQLPLALAKKELDGLDKVSTEYEACLICDSFLDVLTAMETGEVAALLPDFLAPAKNANSFRRVSVPKLDSLIFHFHFAWNPRLLRLNPHATRKRDSLTEALSKSMAGTRSAD